MPAPVDPGAAQAAFVFFGSFFVLALFLRGLRGPSDQSRSELYERNLRDQHRD